MSDNIELQLTYRKVISIGWVIIAIVSVILLVLGLIINKDGYWYSYGISFLLGSMTNVFAFNLLKNYVSNITDDSKKAITGSYQNYFIRFLIYAGVLYLSFNNEKLNAYIVAAGFITIRLAIYIYTYLNKRK